VVVVSCAGVAVPRVELPGIESGTKTVLNCGNAQSDCAKRRENRFPFQGHIHPVRVAYT
jgi:hypothetical protein